MSATSLRQQHLEKLLERLCGNQPQAASTQTQPEVVIGSNAKPPLYAVIIGINDYEEFPKLKAAVSDAKEFKNYPVNDLLVPEDQITLMLDRECTRANIISALQNLAKDTRIEKGDPILIYYAGLGSAMDYPLDHEMNRPQVQCIIPQDTNRTTGVVPIPDFTIRALLTQLANEKGDNITLILDCCHSGTNCRCCHEGVRFIHKSFLPTLPPNLDSELIKAATGGTGALVDAEGFGNSGTASHVLLAACAHGEAAFETSSQDHGCFTKALLHLFRRMKVDSLTYKGSMQHLPTLITHTPQNPVCQGKNTDRLFFNGKVTDARNHFIDIKCDELGDYYLQAGVAQGITPGCTFAVYKNRVVGPENPSIGTLVVDKAEPFHALLKLPEGAQPITIDEIAYGRQSGYGADHALNVCFTDAFIDAAEPDKNWSLAFSGGGNKVILRPTERDLADLVVDINKEGRTTFTTCNPSAIAHGIPTLPHTTRPTAEPVIRVLTAAARWNYYLRHMPGERPFQSSVQMEFYKLSRSRERNDRGRSIYQPEGPNLSMGGEADICVGGPDQKQNIYGFSIKNNSSRDLYAYMFMFSCTDLSNFPIYTKMLGSGKVGPTLPKGECLTLGHGSSAEPPVAFAVNEGEDIDLGIVKVFLTTEPTDFDSIGQDTPFIPTRMIPSNEVEDLGDKQPLWDVITMTLVQRRNLKEEKHL